MHFDDEGATKVLLLNPTLLLYVVFVPLELLVYW